MNRKFIKSTILALMSLVAVGCEGGGGLGCGLSVPSCCYDNLFGCEIFDLPFGCSCQDFGFPLTQSIAALTSMPSSRSANPSPGLSGEWAGALSLTSSSCDAFLPKVIGAVEVRQFADKVKVFASTYGKLSGKSKNGKYLVSGRYFPAGGECGAYVQGKFDPIDVKSGSAQVKINYVCGKSSLCSARYKGVLEKHN